MMTKRVSIEEFLDSRGYGGVKRKQFSRDDGVILKAMPTDIIEKAGYNAEKRSIRFVMSAQIEDRDRDIVMQAGLDTSGFEKNPVAPWAHRSAEPPVGVWSDLTKHLTGRPIRTEGTLTLTAGEPMADRLDAHFKAGSLRACSIGFMPKEIERREVPEDAQDEFYYYPGYVIHAADLYECSPCTIPANPAALAKAAKEGDTLSLEIIKSVLDNWDVKDGLYVPRKEFEKAHHEATGERTLVVIDGRKYRLPGSVKDGEDVVLKPEPKEDSLLERLEKHESMMEKIWKAITSNLKGGTADADPAPEQDGPKPAPEPTPEEKLKDELARDLPELEKIQADFEHKCAIRELEESLAALDAEWNERNAA